jgi:hypothetical protein
VWRREPGGGPVRLEHERFRPWVLIAEVADLAHLGARVQAEPADAALAEGVIGLRTLTGPGALRYRVSAGDEATLIDAILGGARPRLGRALRSLRELGPQAVLVLPPEEQYLVATGRTMFRGLSWDDVPRAQIDLETTGLDPERHEIFLAALRAPDGSVTIVDAERSGGEARLITALATWVRGHDPDVIENHNLHGFDLPFLARRAELLGVALDLGRLGQPGLGRRPAARGGLGLERARHTIPGRECIDSLDAVWRHDFSARDLPGHGLKVVARHLGLAGPDRELIPGALVHAVYRTDPARVARYAEADVHEAAGVSRLLGGAAFVLAQMSPRRYERLADTGAATGVIDPLLVRAYLRAGHALPAHEPGDGTEHTGAALHLFATGVAERVVKADVASLYPSLMRQYRIGPRRDRLGVLVGLVDELVTLRLGAKARARAALAGSPAQHAEQALSAALKLVVNSAYGYLAATGLTRFADVHAANEVTGRGRDLLAFLCDALAERGSTLIEADTDGVYVSVPAGWSEADERRLVDEVAAHLPEHVHLEYDGRYAAMLSHEPKNYALLTYDGRVVLRGVAFRSSRSEPFGEAFLRAALACLLAGDVVGVRAAYVAAAMALRRRELATAAVAATVRLRKTPAEYLAQRSERRELAYEALLLGGRDTWASGERVRVYRQRGGRPALWTEPDGDGDDATADTAAVQVAPQVAVQAAPQVAPQPTSDDAHSRGHASTRAPVPGADRRDYDVDWYLKVLVGTYAARLARAFSPDDFAAVFADPEQISLFPVDLGLVRPILTILARTSADLVATP